MRWKIIFGLMILLSFSFVLAGNSYDVSFEGQNSQAIYLYEDDEVRFELLDGEHSLIVEEVTTTGAKFDVVPFIHDEITNAWPGIVTLDTIMKVDLDKDGYNDLNVALHTVAADGEVHLVLQVADEVNVKPESSFFSRTNPTSLCPCDEIIINYWVCVKKMGLGKVCLLSSRNY